MLQRPPPPTPSYSWLDGQPTVAKSQGLKLEDLEKTNRSNAALEAAAGYNG